MAVSNREAKALQRLADALRRPPAIQDNALAAARRTAKSPDALYWLTLLELELGRVRNDDALRASALDRLIANPRTAPEKMTGYLDVRGGIAFKAGDLATARTHWTRLLTLKPNDPEVLGNLPFRSPKGIPLAGQSPSRAGGRRARNPARVTASSYRSGSPSSSNAGLRGRRRHGPGAGRRLSDPGPLARSARRLPAARRADGRT